MSMLRDLVTDKRSLALISIGCGVYLLRKAYCYYMENQKQQKKSFREQHGYERYPPEGNFPDLRLHNNLLAAHLSPDLYEDLRRRVTSTGYTLDYAIQEGVDNPGVPWEKQTGVIAGDEECYKVFEQLFDPIINSFHGCGPDTRHSTDVDANKVKNGHFTNPAVLSVRVTGRRCLSGYRFPSFCGREERKWLESAIVTALKSLQEEFHGEYRPLDNIVQDEQLRLTVRGTMFQMPQNKILARDWPQARGIFCTNDNSFVVWVNAADHLQVTCLSAGGDLEGIFSKYTRGMISLERALDKNGEKFAFDKRIGYMNSDPKYVGTTLKTTVRLRLPHLLHDGRLHYILKALKLRRVQRKSSQELDQRNKVMELYNAVVFGESEVQIVQNVVNGVEKLLSLEKMLERRQSIQQFLPTVNYNSTP